MRARLLLFAALAWLAAFPALAVNPDEMLSDATLEARAREISKGLRCVVCRNQNIDSSNAGIARDMRLVLRERLLQGDTDEEATAYIADRYGSYVLLKPPFNPLTYLLWFGPFLILAAIAYGFARWQRRAAGPEADEPLTDADRALLASLTHDEEAGG